VFPRHDQAQFFLGFAQRRIQHRFIASIVLAAGKSDLAAMNPTWIPQDHHDTKVAVMSAVNWN
jgi:hypothetical protein